MIGIIGAMAVETETLITSLSNKKEQTIAGMPFVTGQWDGADVTVCTCGPGKVFAAVGTQILIDRFAPDYLINSGVAGSLCSDLGIGDLAIADAVLQHDMDTSPLGDPVGMISRINLIQIPCDPGLVNMAIKAVSGQPYHWKVGTIATGDQFIGNAEQKRSITDRFDAVSCEMEGGAVGHTAYLSGIPFLVLRVISDSADGEAPESFGTFARESAEKSVFILKTVISEIAKGDKAK